MPYVTDSYGTGNATSIGFALSFNDDIAAGQVFYNASRSTLSSVQFYMKKVGATANTGLVKIYAITGTPGSTAVPTGTAFTIASFDATAISTSFTLYTYTPGSQYILNDATWYAVVVEYAQTGGSNYLLVNADNTSPTHAGNSVEYYSGGWHATPSLDTIFYVNAELFPLINLVVQDSTLALSSDEPAPDLPGSEGSLIYGGWGSFFLGSSYAGSGSNFGAPELGVYESRIGMTSDNVTLTEDVPLTVNDSTIGVSSDAPLPIVDITISAQDSTIGVSSENVVVDATVAVTLPDDSTIGISSDSVDLAQQHHLTSEDSTLGITADSVVLLQKHYLIVDDSRIALTTEETNLLQDFHLTLDDVLIGLSSDTATVLISFNPGTIDTGEYTPKYEGTAGELVTAESVPVGEYTPQALTPRTWGEGDEVDTGSWNTP